MPRIFSNKDIRGYSFYLQFLQWKRESNNSQICCPFSRSSTTLLRFC